MVATEGNKRRNSRDLEYNNTEHVSIVIVMSESYGSANGFFKSTVS